MSTLPRSKSAPSVTPPQQPFLASQAGNALRPHRPRVVRHHTSLALTDLSGPSSATRSGQQTPRGDRTDDPFSLGGFFPPQLPGNDAPTAEWTWLREHAAGEDDAAMVHDEAWLEELHLVPTLGKTGDEATGELIRREDKLGVLSLRALS